MKIFAILAFCLIGSSGAARILGIFPTPSISHQIVFHSLMKELAGRGHQLTILTTDVIKALEKNPNVTQIDLHGSYEIFREGFSFVGSKAGNADEASLIQMLHPVFLKTTEFQLSHPEVKKLIKKQNGEKFDVLIAELMNGVPMMAFAELFHCPIVEISSLDNWAHAHEAMGNVVNPAVHSDLVFSFVHGHLTFAERWRSLKFYLTLKFLHGVDYNQDHDDLVRKHFPSVTKSVTELRSRVQLLMTNTNPAMGLLRPSLPNTIQLGFMHIEPPKPLPEGELKNFLDNSKNGVVYLSFGSNVQSKDLDPEILKMFLKVFGSLDCNVLWKFEKDDLPNKPKNVMISKWLPQGDMLAHPAIKLFIMQGGQQSIEEAIDRTVPIIAIPFVGDQGLNAKRVEIKGIGKRLELNGLTESQFASTIREVLKPKYKENIVKLRELVYDQPMTSRERAVWWTEYVIRHKGAKHLEYPGRLVPFYQKYWLDFIGIGILATLIAVKIFLMMLRKMFSSNKVKKD